MGKDFMDRFPKPLWGRNSTPEEQGHLVVFLNSDAANYITGNQRLRRRRLLRRHAHQQARLLALMGETPPAEQRDRRTIRGR